ncbi:hypothetical protein V5S96_09155 [Corynebacterium mastitidis]|uniref:Uncharacterized protein n=1 Tax=Corynebacterium mastitidis TaxID=161890 RepID=A0ABU8NZT6_9CORY
MGKALKLSLGDHGPYGAGADIAEAQIVGCPKFFHAYSDWAMLADGSAFGFVRFLEEGESGFSMPVCDARDHRWESRGMKEPCRTML